MLETQLVLHLRHVLLVALLGLPQLVLQAFDFLITLKRFISHSLL
jgi:hypothetical protein